MKHIYLAFALFFVYAVGMAQVIIDGKDINKESIETFEVYLLTKPFNTQESIGANTGSNNFRLHYYDLKRQAIYDSEGRKFEKGEYLKLFNYLKTQGWEFENERNITYQNGRVIIFKRKKSESGVSNTNGIDFCSKLIKEVDKFTDKVTYITPPGAIRFYKADEKIFIILVSHSRSFNTSAAGTIILFDDKTKLDLGGKIDVKSDSDGMYEYTAFLQLSQNDIVKLKTKRITDYRLYMYDASVPEENPYKEYLKCILEL